jgi:ADP-heptose:LPS heptosyltransferase
MFTVPVDIASAHGDSSRHWLDIQLDYVRALGFATEGARPYLYVSDQEREAARHLLTGHGIDPSARLCALHIGKGVPLTADRWPLARFVDVGRQMVAAGYSVVLIGSHAEQPLASRIATAVGTGASVISSGTVRELSALIGTMTVVITPDSGPGHIAAALGVPVVSIFALKAAPIARWRPWTPDHRVVTTAPWVCPKNCIKEKCRRFDCLEHFDPLQVVNAALELADCRGHD